MPNAPATVISWKVGIGKATFLICIIGSPERDFPQKDKLTEFFVINLVYLVIRKQISEALRHFTKTFFGSARSFTNRRMPFSFWIFCAYIIRYVISGTRLTGMALEKSALVSAICEARVMIA